MDATLYLVPLIKSCCHNCFKLRGVFWQCCTTLKCLPPLSGQFLWKEDRNSVTMWSRSIGLIKSQNVESIFLFRNTKRILPRGGVGCFNVDHRVKDCVCLVRLDTRASPTAKHFLVLWARGVDAGIVKVILFFDWFSLCCRSQAIGQSWDVLIHRTRKWLREIEDIRAHLENNLHFLEAVLKVMCVWFIQRALVVTSGPTMQAAVGLTHLLQAFLHLLSS